MHDSHMGRWVREMWDFMKATHDQFTNTLNYRKHALNVPLVIQQTLAEDVLLVTNEAMRHVTPVHFVSNREYNRA